MKPAILALMAVSLLGCRREINVNIDIKIIDTGDVATSGSSGSSGSSSNQSTDEPDDEPSFEPSGEPSGDPNGGGDDPNGGGDDPNGGGDDPNGGGDDPNGGGDDPNGGGDDPNGGGDDPNGGGNNDGGNNGGGQQEGGGPDFCGLVDAYIACGDSSASGALDYCEDGPEAAGSWALFLDCLVEAGGTDCADLSACSSDIP